jgi:signal transduction histidine kinase/CheY-like chemotaxis protein
MGPLLRGDLRKFLASSADKIPRSLSIAFDILPASEEFAGAIRAAQISAIVRLTPIAMLASCLNVAILLATFGAMGELRWQYWLWAALIFTLAAYYVRNWRRSRPFDLHRTASRRAIRRTVISGCVFGVLWAALPVAAFPGAPPHVQLFIAVLTSGMMCAGGFVLATVPLAGVSYIAIVAAGSFYALLRESAPVYIGITALTVAYTAVLIISVNWSASLFVFSRLAEAQVRAETAAREQAQAQAAHAERMSALGELAGGIAHDFNNILQAVSAGAMLIQRRPEDQDNARRQAQQIEAAVERGAAISRRLLGFARQDVLRPEHIDVAELLGQVRELLTHAIEPSIDIKLDAAASAPGFVADRFQLETVLLNLATNARDAMLPNGGTLTISAATEVLDRGSHRPALKAGRYTRISVSDTGVGMTAATLARAGQPFFTTKPKGKGTGLGLSMAKGFAERSGGALAIASEPGQGATVTLWLPQDEAGAAAPAVAAEPTPAEPPPAHLRVLLVDDDAVVRDMLATSLEDAGFQISRAASAEGALDQLDGGLEVDALVTDISMPGMSGWDLIQQLKTRHPELPSLMLTGHLDDAWTESLSEERRIAIVRKPVSPANLAQRIAALTADSPRS